MSGNVIPFNQIPPNLRVPLFYAEFDNSQAGVSQPVQRRLIIGQSTTAQPAVPVYVPSAAWAASTFGPRSQIANAIAAYIANDPVGELWALPLADATGSSAATGTVTVTGTATAAGTLNLYIGAGPTPFSPTAQPLQVGVNVGDTATVIAGNIAAAINANTPGSPAAYLRVTATSALGVVTLTAANKGTLGNQIPVVLNYLGARGGQVVAAGITVAIAAMAGGATDPSLATIATMLGVQPFDFIATPYSDLTNIGDTSALMSFTGGRWSYSSQIYGHVFSAHSDTLANLITYGTALNDPHTSIFAVNQASPTPPDIWCAAAMGQMAPSIVIQPNRPVQSLALIGVLPAPAANEFTFSNQQTLLTSGLAVAARGASGVAQIVRAVTTYQTNTYGQADTSYLDTETMYLSMAIIRALQAAVTQKFPRALLADDGARIPETPPGQTPVLLTPSIIKGEMVAQYGAMVDAGWCENETGFAAGLTVQRNVNDNSRVDILYDPYYVSGLRVLAVLNQFHLQAAQAAA